MEPALCDHVGAPPRTQTGAIKMMSRKSREKLYAVVCDACEIGFCDF